MPKRNLNLPQRVRVKPEAVSQCAKEEFKLSPASTSAGMSSFRRNVPKRNLNLQMVRQYFALGTSRNVPKRNLNTTWSTLAWLRLTSRNVPKRNLNFFFERFQC